MAGIRKTFEGKVQRQLGLEFNKEMWIDVSPSIQLPGKARAGAKVKREKNLEKDSCRMENPAEQRSVSLRGFQHSDQTAALLLRTQGTMMKQMIFKQRMRL